MEVRLFDKAVDDFIKSLQKPTRAKAGWMIELLERHGPGLGMPYSKKITGKIFELRIHSRETIRVLYAFWKGSAYLLHGFVKKTDKIPAREIETAMRKLAILEGLR